MEIIFSVETDVVINVKKYIYKCIYLYAHTHMCVKK